MLIPSIDLQGGRIVQLQQGERLVVESDDIEGWIARFDGFPLVQVIDLDAAKRRGSNRDIVKRISRVRPCQVGGGIRTAQEAADAVAAGAKAVIIGSALFSDDGIRIDAAQAFEAAVGRDRLIAAVDARGARVSIHGWQTTTRVAVVDAVNALEPYFGGFLATLIDGEGLLGGIDMTAIQRVRQATTRRLIAAGGIRSHAEVDALDAIDVDAVVGMAIYTGVMSLERS